MSDADSDYNSDAVDSEAEASPRGAKRRADPPPQRNERPKRAAAARVSQLVQQEESEDEEDEEEFPVIPKAVLTKYKDQLNCKAGTILVIRKQSLDPAMLSALKVSAWPIWENSTGGWPDLNNEYEYEHGKRELSYILEGSATVTPDGGQPVTINAGDYAVFPKKLSCTWVLTAPLKKHYYEFPR